MRRLSGLTFVAILLAGTALPALGDDKDAAAVLDKAIEALGGKDKLAKAATATWKGKGTISLNGDDSPIKTRTVAQGLDRHRAEFEGEFGGNEIKGVTILVGDKGWRKFNDDAQDLDGDALAGEKQRAYLQAVPMTVLPLREKGFKIGAVSDEKVGDKPAVAVKATGPDGKDFTVSFDKESGLPVKLVATVKGFGGEDAVQETTYSGYKDFDGLKRYTKVEVKRDGTKFITYEITDYKVLDAVEPGTFDEPK